MTRWRAALLQRPAAERASAIVKAGVNVAPPKMVHEAGPHQVGVSCVFEDPDGNLLSVYGLMAKAVWDSEPRGTRC